MWNGYHHSSTVLRNRILSDDEDQYLPLCDPLSRPRVALASVLMHGPHLCVRFSDDIAVCCVASAMEEYHHTYPTYRDALLYCTKRHCRRRLAASMGPSLSLQVKTDFSPLYR